MRLAVAADHAGTPLNEVAIAELRKVGHEVLDLGQIALSHAPWLRRTLGESRRAAMFAGFGGRQ